MLLKKTWKAKKLIMSLESQQQQKNLHSNIIEIWRNKVQCFKYKHQKLKNGNKKEIQNQTQTNWQKKWSENIKTKTNELNLHTN